MSKKRPRRVEYLEERDVDGTKWPVVRVISVEEAIRRGKRGRMKDETALKRFLDTHKGKLVGG